MNHTMTVVKLDGVDPLAVCNDGSPAIYGFQKSPTGSNKWLVILAGGASCYDEKTCTERWNHIEPGDPLHHLMSTKNFSSTITK